MATRPKVTGRQGTYDRMKRVRKPHESLYTKEWKRASKHFREQHPFCFECLFEERIKLAQCTDHIIAHHGDEDLFWHRHNWQPLCNHHHATKGHEVIGNWRKWRPHLTVVCGLPGVGKSTFVKQHYETYWDTDEHASTGKTMSVSDSEIARLRKQREAFATTATNEAAIIISNPTYASICAERWGAWWYHLLTDEVDRQDRIADRV